MTKKWWHDKVAYQIYPKSFYDTNGDGIGDLEGVIQKLDYLKDLGIDIIWLSPVYCSPMADQGYDISDYYNIDPRFGTMEDMDRLLEEAKKRSMYVLMDLVVNHCSDEHEWFQKALEDPDGKYGKYFYIEESDDGKLPANWRSYFGGNVWEQIPGTNKYYMHLFHKKQPDLNWENREVREEVYKMINWWLDKGLAGFRIDAIINIKKVLPPKDYPADRADGLSSLDLMLEEAEGVGEFLQEMRDAAFRPHEAFTVGEVFNEKPEELPEFIGDEGYFSTIFDFSTTVLGRSEKGWYDNAEITPEEYKRTIFDSQERVKGAGFLANIIENHDEPRGVSRYIPEGECNDKSKKMLALITLMRRGIPFIYQGQEIGMENIEFTSIEQVDDIFTLAEYETALKAGLSEKEALKCVNAQSRDNARTPFQWNDSKNAGFTDGIPWLEVNPKYTSINAQSQVNNNQSVREFYKELIKIRKGPHYSQTVVYGEMIPVLEEEKNLIAFYREGDAKLLILANFQNKEREVELPEGYKKIVLNNYDMLERKEADKIVLEPYQSVILEV